MLDMRCHLFDALPAPGGQCAALYPEKPIYDIPGYPRINAAELVERLGEQAAPFAPVFHLGHPVIRLESAADGFIVENAAGVRVGARAVVIAAGAGAFGPNRPPLAGIEAFEESSVFYLVRRREDFRGRHIVIAGGGDSAVDWALSLAEIAERVMVVHRRAKFRAAPQSAARLQQMAAEGRIELVIPYQLHALEGEGGQLSAVIVADLEEIRAASKPIACCRSSVLPPISARWRDGGSRSTTTGSSSTRRPAPPRGRASSRSAMLRCTRQAQADPVRLRRIGAGGARDLPARPPGEALHFEYSTTKGVPGR